MKQGVKLPSAPAPGASIQAAPSPKTSPTTPVTEVDLDSQVRRAEALGATGSAYPAFLQGLENSSGYRAVDRLRPAVTITTGHELGGGAIQRANVIVGFDGTATQSMFAAPGNVLKTAGVANCVVVVARDTGGGGAVMRHYDTLNATAGTGTDDHTGEDTWEFDAAAFATMRDEMVAQLGANIAAVAGVEYEVSLGGVWADVDSESPLWQSRINLILALHAAFGVEPSRAGSTASFNTTTNVLGA